MVGTRGKVFFHSSSDVIFASMYNQGVYETVAAACVKIIFRNPCPEETQSEVRYPQKPLQVAASYAPCLGQRRL